MQLALLPYMQMTVVSCWQLVNIYKNEQKKMDMHSGRYYRAAVGSYSGFIDPAYEKQFLCKCQ